MNRFASLSDRERRALVLAAAAVLLALVYLLVLAPLQKQLADDRQGLQTARSLYQHLVLMAAESKSLRATSVTGGVNDGRSLLAVVDDTARAAGLAETIGEMTPDGQGQVRMTLDKVSFDRLMLWLVQLEQKNRITVDKITVTAGDKPGEVRVVLTLQGAR